jgi:hypothetical protein
MEAPAKFPGEALDVKDVFAGLAQRYPEYRDRFDQQDVDELYARLLECIEGLSAMFEVKGSTTITCSACRAESRSPETHTVLHARFAEGAPADGPAVPLQLQSMVDALRAPVALHGGTAFFCATCNAQRPATSVRAHTKCGQTLGVLLGRFVGDASATGLTRKVRTPVEYGRQLALTLRGADGKERAVEGDLCAVIVHVGTGLVRGHYIAYIRDANGAWHEQNDATSSPSTEEAALAWLHDAYLLLYRMGPDPSATAEPAPPNSAGAPATAGPPATRSTSVRRRRRVAAHARRAATQACAAHPPTHLAEYAGIFGVVCCTDASINLQTDSSV